MSALKPIVTIGDGIIDAVKLSDSPPTLYPGGAGLNLAVGLARLGIASVLAARIGLDRNGFRLMRYLREEGVELINTPNADFTGVAASRRRAELRFHAFSVPAAHRIQFNSSQGDSRSSGDRRQFLSYADTKQADALSEALSRVTGLKILDPNPRPRLIADLEAFREGFERTIRTATLVRLSGEDAKLLYGREDDGVAESLFERGVEIVLLTRGKLGASLASSPARD
jgi:fructokinase